MKTPSIFIHELYRSVQGESSFVGHPCTFIRLSGCNLRCTWCDTPEAFKKGTPTDIAAIIEQTLALQTPLVEVTGGEPLLQQGTIPLLRELCDRNKVVLLETSGERDISQVDSRVHKIMDLKAPHSGESHRNRFDNIEYLSEKDEVKIVIQNREDYLWAKEMLHRFELHTRCKEVLFSPVHAILSPEQLIHWILEDALPVRFQLQIHKYIWGASAQGV